MKKENMIILALAILLAIALVYIAFTKFQQREYSIYQSGATYGYESALLTVFDKASQCQQVPIYANNQSITLIAAECLQLPQKNSSK